MATLKELIELSGVQQIAPGRTVGEQRDAGMYASGELQYDDVAPADYGFTGQIQDGSKFQDPFYSGMMQITQPLRNTFNKYGPQIAGGIMSLATGIPGIGFLMSKLRSDPYAQNRIDMYGVGKSSAGFDVDKFGYNLGTTLMKNRFMEPGTNSFRSYALEGLRSLDPIAADQFYQQTYGKSYDDVKRDIQRKQDPFSQQNVFEGTSDYQGDGGSGGQGGVQSSGFANDGGPVSNRTGRGRQGY